MYELVTTCARIKIPKICTAHTKCAETETIENETMCLLFFVHSVRLLFLLFLPHSIASSLIHAHLVLCDAIKTAYSMKCFWFVCTLWCNIFQLVQWREHIFPPVKHTHSSCIMRLSICDNHVSKGMTRDIFGYFSSIFPSRFFLEIFILILIYVSIQHLLRSLDRKKHLNRAKSVTNVNNLLCDMKSNKNQKKIRL